MPVRKSLYLDTNAFIYAYFYGTRTEQAQRLVLDYYNEGKHVLGALEVCRENQIRVYSTDLAYLEMSHNFYEWERLRQLLSEGAPPGLIFGKNQRMDSSFLKKKLNKEILMRISSTSKNWLKSWEYNDLIEFQAPDNVIYWFEIAKYLYSFVNETVIDCLHLAAAISLECNFFLTNDQPLRDIISDMRKDKRFKKDIIKKFNLTDEYGLPCPAIAKTFKGD